MWEWRFTDWNLAIEVAKIPNDVWEEGAEAVADAIHEIKAWRAINLPSVKPENVSLDNVTNLVTAQYDWMSLWGDQIFSRGAVVRSTDLTVSSGFR